MPVAMPVRISFVGGGEGGVHWCPLDVQKSPFRRSSARTCFCFCISTADEPQRPRLPIPPTVTLLSCLLSLRVLSFLPGSRLRFFIAMQVKHSYTSSTNGND